MNITKEVPQENHELIKRDHVENTPFTIIELNGAYFGTMGQYRITEPTTDKEQLKKDLETFNWNRVIQVLMLLNEQFNVNDIQNDEQN